MSLQASVAQGFKFSKFMDVCRHLGGTPDLPGYKTICIHNLQFSRKCLHRMCLTLCVITGRPPIFQIMCQEKSILLYSSKDGTWASEWPITKPLLGLHKHAQKKHTSIILMYVPCILYSLLSRSTNIYFNNISYIINTPTCFYASTSPLGCLCLLLC